MRPGSIYAAFQSKEALFRTVLAKYVEAVEKEFNHTLGIHPSVLDGIAAFIRKFAEPPKETPPSKACMVVKTLLEVSEAQSPIAVDANTYLAKMEAAFVSAFEKARARGEIAEQASPVSLARRLQASIFGLRVYAQRWVTDRAVQLLAEDIAQDVLALRVDTSTIVEPI